MFRLRLKKLISAGILSSFSALFVTESIAKPQNARSRIYNEFHTSLFAKEPPLRSECPSWNDVVKGDTFDNEAFSAISKNGRPCFVNRGKYAYDISDQSGNTASGRNFAIYRTAKKNHYELDFALRFYIGDLSGNPKNRFDIFKKRMIKCVEENRIILTDGTRFLKLKTPVITSHHHKNKAQTLKLKEIYGQNDFDKNIFGINLHNDRKRNTIDNYKIDILCPTIIHELMHITGLHDIYTEKNKITGKEKTYTVYLPVNTDDNIIELSKQHCLNYGHISYNDKICKNVLISKKLIKIKGKFPLFDCRNPKDYPRQKINIMNNHRVFFNSKEPITFRICKTDKPIGVNQKNKNQKQCSKHDKPLLISVIPTLDDLKYTHSYAKNNLNLKKSEYYIAYYDSRKSGKLTTSLTRQQFSMLLHTNNLDHPEVREFARVAKNAYRNRYEKVYGGCRR